MMALALSEDSIRLRPKRNSIIDALGVLPDQIREVRPGAPITFSLRGFLCTLDTVRGSAAAGLGSIWQTDKRSAAAGPWLPLQTVMCSTGAVVMCMGQRFV